MAELDCEKQNGSDELITFREQSITTPSTEDEEVAWKRVTPVGTFETGT